MRNLRVLFGFAAVLAATAAAADVPLPAGIPDILGPRGLALGAYRGVTGSNDAMFTNAASLGVVRHYVLEGDFFLDRVSGSDAVESFTISAVDGTSGTYVAGIGYTRVLTAYSWDPASNDPAAPPVVRSGGWSGHLFHVPIAFAASDTLYLGVTPKFFWLDAPETGSTLGHNYVGPQSVETGNVDLSFFVKGGMVGFGAAGYNLINAGHHLLMPRGAGVGISIGDGMRYDITADWKADFDTRAKMTSLFAVGAEYLIADVLPVRASYVHDDTRASSFWSAGIGIVPTTELAFDFSYRQRFEDPSEYTVAAGLRLFLQ